MEHLVIIIDNNKNIVPKKYSCPFSTKTKEEAIKAAKSQYETKYKNKEYEAYYFEH